MAHTSRTVIQRPLKDLTDAAHKARAVTTDVTDKAQVKRLIDTAVEEFGRIDVLLNNAGLMPLALLEELKVDEWDQMIDVNLKGTLYGIAAAPSVEARADTVAPADRSAEPVVRLGLVADMDTNRPRPDAAAQPQCRLWRHFSQKCAGTRCGLKALHWPFLQ